MKGIVANPLILTGLVVLSIVLLLTPYLIRQSLRLPGRAQEDPLAIRGSSGNWDRRDFQTSYTIPGKICNNANGHVNNIDLIFLNIDGGEYFQGPPIINPAHWDLIDWPNCEFFTVNLSMNQDTWQPGSGKRVSMEISASGDLFRGTHTESVSGSKILRIGISAVATPTLPPSPTPESEPTITSQPTVTTTPTTTPPVCTPSCALCDADGNGVYDPTIDGNLIWRNIDTNCDGQKDIADVSWCNGNCIAQPTPTVTVAPGTGRVTANVSVNMGEYSGCGDHLFLAISTPGVLLYHDRYEFPTLTGGTHTFRNVPPGEYDVYAFIIVGTQNTGEEVGLDLETITVVADEEISTNLVVEPLAEAADSCPSVTLTPTPTATPTVTPTVTATVTPTPSPTSTALPDLTIESIEVKDKESGATPIVGEPVSITTVVKNIGQTNAGEFDVYLYVDVDPSDEPNEYISLIGKFGLPKDYSFTWTFRGYTFDSDGLHFIYAWVDRDDAVDESNESNNLQRKEFNVNPADYPTCGEPTISPPSPQREPPYGPVTHTFSVHDDEGLDKCSIHVEKTNSSYEHNHELSLEGEDAECELVWAPAFVQEGFYSYKTKVKDTDGNETTCDEGEYCIGDSCLESLVFSARVDVNGDGVEGDIRDWTYALEHYGEMQQTPQGMMIINALTLSNILSILTAP